MRLMSACSIVKGKDHEYLFINIKEDEISAEIIDPMIGTTEIINIKSFAIEQHIKHFDNETNLIGSDQVKQIIMIDFDESKSMIADLDGYYISPMSDNDHRITISHQYLRTFFRKIYGYNIKCIQGLISFNSKVNIRCPLGLPFMDFDDKGLKNIQPNSISKLWDSLLFCCKQIVKFRKDSKGNEL